MNTPIIEMKTTYPGTWATEAYRSFMLEIDDEREYESLAPDPNDDIVTAMAKQVRQDLFAERHKDLLLRLESRSKMSSAEGWF